MVQDFRPDIVCRYYTKKKGPPAKKTPPGLRAATLTKQGEKREGRETRRREGREGRRREERRGTADALEALAKAADNRYRPGVRGRIVRSLR